MLVVPSFRSAATLTVFTCALLQGCSSKSPAAGGNDASLVDSAASTDTGTVDSQATSQDSSHTDGTAKPPPDADAGMDCGTAASAAGFKPSPYVPVVGNQGVCSGTQVAAFINDCIVATQEAPCNTWAAENVASDAGAGTPCGNCILPAVGSGPIWTDPLGYIWPNIAACIQLSDPTAGPACAAAFDNISGCVDTACDVICNVDTEYCGGPACSTCSSDLEMTTCKTYQSAVETACAPVVSQANACQSASTQAVAFANLTTMICGGSPVDSGTEQ
jgi:hypothetical protein